MCDLAFSHPISKDTFSKAERVFNLTYLGNLSTANHSHSQNQRLLSVVFTAAVDAIGSAGRLGGHSIFPKLCNGMFCN
jgi:hypothetical protein